MSKRLLSISFFYEILIFFQIDHQIHSLFKSKKSIKAKGDAPVVPNAVVGQNDEGGNATNATDIASKLELAKKRASQYVLID